MKYPQYIISRSQYVYLKPFTDADDPEKCTFSLNRIRSKYRWANLSERAQSSIYFSRSCLVLRLELEDKVNVSGYPD